MLWSCLPLENYPSEELDGLWKKLLINQFHDIIPGSSINLVYQNTHKEYEQIQRDCDSLIALAGQSLFEQSPDSFVLANTLSYPWKGMISIPESFDGFSVLNENGDTVCVQKTKDALVAFVELEPLSFSTFNKGQALSQELELGHGLTLENDLIRYDFDKKGQVISAFDKESKKEVFESAGNILSLYEDRPNDWDAWDVDFYYRNALVEVAEATDTMPGTNGKVVQELDLKFSVGCSSIIQKVKLFPHSKRLDFDTKVDWKEKHKMLRVHFPVNVRAEQATFDIQYGHVQRNTHENTSWDKAKFEVVGHKYADLSDHDYGVALMNDCKYGYFVKDNILDLNLLRSPNNPDPDADQGKHQFTYSIFPHEHDLIRSNVIRESTCLNQIPIVFSGVRSDNGIPVKLDGNGLELTVLKKGEKEDYLIIRIVETSGRHSTGSLKLNGTLTECDFMEWNDTGSQTNVEGSMPLSFSPFEIKTFKFVTKVTPS
jgi:alpha-mannosidase